MWTLQTRWCRNYKLALAVIHSPAPSSYHGVWNYCLECVQEYPHTQLDGSSLGYSGCSSEPGRGLSPHYFYAPILQTCNFAQKFKWGKKQHLEVRVVFCHWDKKSDIFMNSLNKLRHCLFLNLWSQRLTIIKSVSIKLRSDFLIYLSNIPVFSLIFCCIYIICYCIFIFIGIFLYWLLLCTCICYVICSTIINCKILSCVALWSLSNLFKKWISIRKKMKKMQATCNHKFSTTGKP